MVLHAARIARSCRGHTALLARGREISRNQHRGKPLRKQSQNVLLSRRQAHQRAALFQSPQYLELHRAFSP
jgi:hypothetical protein